MAKERKLKRCNQEEEQIVSASEVLASACITAASGLTTAATSFTAACTTVGTAFTTVATAFTSAAAILSSTSPKEKVPTAAAFASTSTKEKVPTAAAFASTSTKDKVATAATSTSTKTTILALPCPKAGSSEKINKFFTEFEGRRGGIIKALTEDYRKFREKCYPESDPLCLYGLPNGTWNVNLPEQILPPNLPQPKRGINFCRNRMNKQEWVAYVSSHSDAWLTALASYRAYPFKKEFRTELFGMIQALPTIFQVVTGTSQKQATIESSGEDPASCSKRARKAGKMKKY